MDSLPDSLKRKKKKDRRRSNHSSVVKADRTDRQTAPRTSTAPVWLQALGPPPKLANTLSDILSKLKEPRPAKCTSIPLLIEDQITTNLSKWQNEQDGMFKKILMEIKKLGNGMTGTNVNVNCKTLEIVEFLKSECSRIKRSLVKAEERISDQQNNIIVALEKRVNELVSENNEQHSKIIESQERLVNMTEKMSCQIASMVARTGSRDLIPGKRTEELRKSVDPEQKQVNVTEVSVIKTEAPRVLADTMNESAVGGGSGMQRTYIWNGVLEWMEKGKAPGDQQKVTKHLPCQVSANSKDIEPELQVEAWPSKLLMQLMPKQLISSIGGQYLKGTKSVVFHLQPNEALEALSKVMVNGYAGCVRITPVSTSQCEIKVLILLYTPDKKAYLGFIPNNQPIFVERLRTFIQQLKMTQAKQLPAPGGAPGIPPNMPSNTGAGGMGGGMRGVAGGLAGPSQQSPHAQSMMMGGGMGGQSQVPQVGQGQLSGQVGQVGGKGGRQVNQLDGLEAARQQNLENIQQLQQTLEAAQQLQQTLEAALQQEAQFKSQMDIMSHLHAAQQQEQHYKQLEEQRKHQLQQQLQQLRGAGGVGVGVGGAGARLMRPMMPTPSNPGLRHLLQQFIQQLKMTQAKQLPAPGGAPGIPPNMPSNTGAGGMGGGMRGVAGGLAGPSQQSPHAQSMMMGGGMGGQSQVPQVGQGQLSGQVGQVGGKGGRQVNQLDGLEAARQQNLENIQQLQQTLEAAQQLQQTLEAALQQEAQFKSQMDIMSHLHAAQQQEQHYKQLEEQRKHQLQQQLQQLRGAGGVGVGVGGAGARLMRPMMPTPSNPGLRHLLQQQPQDRPGGGAVRPTAQPQQFDDVSNYNDFL